MVQTHFSTKYSTLFFISVSLIIYHLPQTAAAVLTVYSLSTAIFCGGRDCKLYMESCKFSVLSASVEAVPLVSDVLENFAETQAE
jgi:hypothetical protein